MTVLSTHPRLPSELTDMVIDHLHDDKQALARCSLVAKSWLNASHFHLFHSIEVRDTSRGCGFIGLLSFLESSCSMSVRNYLKELHLMAHRTPLEELSQPPYRRRHLYPSILAKILSRLPQLRVLTMRDVHFCQDPWRNHVRLPIKLDLLEMDDIGCATEGPDEVLYLLRLFSEVKVLNIGMTLWKVNTDIADIASKMLFYNNHMALNIKIDSLAVDPDPATLDIWLHVFRGLRAMETLQELSLTCMRWKDVEGLGGLIRQAGSHLLGLKLDPVFVVMQEGRIPPNEWFTLGLSSAVNLQNLELEIFFSNETPASVEFNAAIADAMVGILSTLSTTIQYITFNFRSNGFPLDILSDRGNIPWGTILELSGNWTNLQAMIFDFDVDDLGDNFEDCCEVVKENLKDRPSPYALWFSLSSNAAD